MNKIRKYIGLGVAMSLTLSACQKQFDDIVPSGNLLSPKQVQEGAGVSEDAKVAVLSGLYSMLTASLLIEEAGHADFGYPAYALLLEHAGDNVVSATADYNWFNIQLSWSKFNSLQSAASRRWWGFSYKNIKVTNDLLLTTNKEDKAILGQARAMRAWNYFNLARLFQKTYVGNENALCVPIVKEDTPTAVIGNNPRATVKEVYDFILSDLNESLELLKGYRGANKAQVSEAVAYGIRARVHLTMAKYAEAAADAQKAIDLSGASPFGIEDCSIPNFDDVATAKNAMWGIIITSEDAVTKTVIANYTSMFNSLCFGAPAYTTTVNQFKQINTRLYDRIPATDVRKGWWTNEPLGTTGKFTSPLLQKAYPDKVDFLAGKLPRYTHVKFAPNNKKTDDPVNAVDYMLMRVEEMYYILAEAKAMAGDFAGGKQTLEAFEKAYRNPQFASTATNAVELQNEIYTIKRYEFYGEGISWFDMLRLSKGLDRVDVATKNDGGYPPTARFNIDGTSDLFVLMIPESEMQVNKALEGKNNPISADPKDLF